jgi:hypothetical protein
MKLHLLPPPSGPPVWAVLHSPGGLWNNQSGGARTAGSGGGASQGSLLPCVHISYIPLPPELGPPAT